MAKVTEIVAVDKPPHCGCRSKTENLDDSRTISLLSIDLDDDPLSLPIKNAANVALDKDVSEKERKIIRGRAQLADLEVRISQLWEKLKSVRYDVQQSQVGKISYAIIIDLNAIIKWFSVPADGKRQ